MFKRYFEIWERLRLEQICKRWKKLMPYNDSYLNVIRTCHGMSKTMHAFGLTPVHHQREDFGNLNGLRGHVILIKCFQELVVKRKMGANLTSLVYDDYLSPQRLRFT